MSGAAWAQLLALIALLYAPKSGRELRADIKERADDFMEGTEEYVAAAKSRAGEIVSEAKKRSEENPSRFTYAS